MEAPAPGAAPAGAPVDLEAPARALRLAVARAATIAVASEPSPDGDAFGAELALRFMIGAVHGLAPSREQARAGEGPKYVALLNEHGAPPRFRFLEGADAARAPDDEDRAKGYDLLILVDGGIERCGKQVHELARHHARARAYVDHHQAGSKGADYDVVVLDPKKAATTELLGALLETDAWREVPLGRGLAEAIYLGLISDTGSFAYSLTSPATHRLAARILEAGARTTIIHERALLEIALDDLKLAGHVFSQVELLGPVLVGVVRLDMFAGRPHHEVAFDKIVTPMAFVPGVEVTLLLREVAHDEWKISLRSQGHVNVATVARRFSGGGHARAAGCTLHGSLADVRAKLLAELGS